MPIRFVLSARDGGLRLSERAPITTDGSSRSPLPRLVVDTARRFQTHLGFGATVSAPAAAAWQALPDPARQQLLRDCFDPLRGHGHTLASLPDGIGTDGDPCLAFAKAAQRVAGPALRWLLGSSQAALADAAERGQHGGAACDAWAEGCVDLIRSCEARGIAVWGLTVQDEHQDRSAWAGQTDGPQPGRQRVHDHLVTALREAGLGHVNIVIRNTERDGRPDTPQAAAIAWGALYQGGPIEGMDRAHPMHEAWPDPHPSCADRGLGLSANIEPWAWCEHHAHHMINELNRWTAGWIDGLPIPADGHWVTGHFARFIRPGARRVSAVAAQTLCTTAFTHSDGSTAVLATNTQDHALRFALCIDGSMCPVELPPRSIATFVAEAAR